MDNVFNILSQDQPTDQDLTSAYILTLYILHPLTNINNFEDETVIEEAENVVEENIPDDLFENNVLPPPPPPPPHHI